MRTLLFLSAFLSAGVASAALPTVSNVVLSQDAANRAVVTYDLGGAAAVVTVDFKTNGVSIGTANIETLSGDVDKVVQPGEGRKIVWKATRDWPDRKLKNLLTAEVRAWAENAPPPILVVDLTSGATRYYLSTNDVPGEGNVTGDACKTDKMVFRRVQARGTRWRMGSMPNENGRHPTSDETNRWVTLSSDYYLGIYECTQAQFRHLLPNVKCAAFTNQGDMRPCDSVSYQTVRGSETGLQSWPNADPETAHGVDETSFMGVLRQKTGGALLFDLPTEAEWEYACRAGALSSLPNGFDVTVATGNADAHVGEIARYGFNSGKIATGDKVPTDCDPSQGTALVGMYSPNAWGFYDMIGNVSERCLDRYGILGGEDAADPVGAASGDTFVFKGGCWRDAGENCRAAYRGSANGTESYMSRGFRVCLTLPR